MRTEYRSERHNALESHYPACGSDACNQGRISCPVPQACEVPGSHLTFGDALMAIGIVVALAGFVFMGPMVQGWVGRFL